VNHRKNVIRELRIPLPPDGTKAMMDIGAGLVGLERPEMVGGDDPLTQLLQLRLAYDGTELRLPEQEALQQRLMSGSEVGQHAQLLERPDRQILGLVDQEQGPLAATVGRRQEVLKPVEESRLV